MWVSCTGWARCLLRPLRRRVRRSWGSTEQGRGSRLRLPGRACSSGSTPRAPGSPPHPGNVTANKTKNEFVKWRSGKLFSAAGGSFARAACARAARENEHAPHFFAVQAWRRGHPPGPGPRPRPPRHRRRCSGGRRPACCSCSRRRTVSGTRGLCSGLAAGETEQPGTPGGAAAFTSA